MARALIKNLTGAPISLLRSFNIIIRRKSIRAYWRKVLRQEARSHVRRWRSINSVHIEATDQIRIQFMKNILIYSLEQIIIQRYILLVMVAWLASCVTIYISPLWV
jgi:hypothetical protein